MITKDATDVPVGTIVRLMDTNYKSQSYAVVVPGDWAKDSALGEAFTRILQPDSERHHDVINQGGWYIGEGEWPFEIVPEDEVPDHISALAMRCLLDPSFIPELSD